MTGTPQQPNPERAGLHVPTRLSPKEMVPGSGVATGDVAPGDGDREQVPEGPKIPEPRTRRTVITEKDVARYGYTEGCTGMRCEEARREQQERALGGMQEKDGGKDEGG